MDRRIFIGSLALGSFAVPRVTPAQSTRKVSIGIIGLMATSNLVGPQPRSPSTSAFVSGLRELGYVYGEHFVTEPRGTDGRPDRFPGLAAELVRLQVDVIVAPGPALPALKQATSTIPIVMAGAADPVGSGYVQSLRHPGGNVTGLSLQSVETTGKRLEVLRSWSRLRHQWRLSGTGPARNYWQAADAAARERGWKLVSLEIRDVGEIEGVFKAATGARAGALLLSAAALLFPHARRVAEVAARSRLPTMYELRPYVEAGGLISYGADVVDIWRRAGVFVDKILKGAKPADLPVEQPSKFETVINLKAAKALGLTVPQSLRLRADEVIQ